MTTVTGHGTTVRATREHRNACTRITKRSQWLGLCERPSQWSRVTYRGCCSPGRVEMTTRTNARVGLYHGVRYEWATLARGRNVSQMAHSEFIPKKKKMRSRFDLQHPFHFYRYPNLSIGKRKIKFDDTTYRLYTPDLYTKFCFKKKKKLGTFYGIHIIRGSYEIFFFVFIVFSVC